MTAFIFFRENLNGKFYNSESIELYWLIIGNVIYYFLAILLASILKDNRAFCKYICPIPVFQKIGARFALMKNEIDKNLCINCKKCETNCPMEIKLLDYMKNNQRILSTECILCLNCANVCQVDAVSLTVKIDLKNKRKE